MRQASKAFTIMELMVVILIVGILASVMVPLMKARIDKSKWSEACTSAGSIRKAIHNYYGEMNITTVKALVGSNLGNSTVQSILGFAPNDLEGTYFSPADYAISSINDDGVASISVKSGSKDNSPSGSYVLQEDGKWVMQ